MEEVAREEPVAAAQDPPARIEQPAIEAPLDQPSGSRALVASAGASSRQVRPDASIDDVLKAWDELKAREVNAHSMKIVSQDLVAPALPTGGLASDFQLFRAGYTHWAQETANRFDEMEVNVSVENDRKNALFERLRGELNRFRAEAVNSEAVIDLKHRLNAAQTAAAEVEVMKKQMQAYVPVAEVEAALNKRDDEHAKATEALRLRAEAAEKVQPTLNAMAEKLGKMRADVSGLTASDRANDQALADYKAKLQQRLEAEVVKINKLHEDEKNILCGRINTLEEAKKKMIADYAEKEAELNRKDAALATRLLRLDGEISTLFPQSDVNAEHMLEAQREDFGPSAELTEAIHLRAQLLASYADVDTFVEPEPKEEEAAEDDGEEADHGAQSDSALSNSGKMYASPKAQG
ncbi:hypothetical protein ACQ4PT_009437 [Festuca glaucescens]